ncbi:hypothetical protein [Hydrogenophaga sp. 5NK40-0174]|uniref:hypothetical protein n=1 Tax=Hydrogenophaga sp. 5NK40-0174 TaxID=3127649 RepID=UPI00333F6F82
MKKWKSFTMALLMASPSVWSADPMTDAMQVAYAPYRAALFATNSGSAAEAGKAVEQGQAQWAKVVKRFGAKPVAPYDKDPEVDSTFKAVSGVYAKAKAEVQEGKLGQAHETLERIRDLLAGLRERNQVIVFSDHMNAYHAEMEHMIVEGPVWLKSEDGLSRVQSQTGVLAYLAAQLAAKAPAALSSDAAFEQALAAVQKSVADMGQASASGDRAAIKDAIKGLKKPYSKLFLNFG